MEPLTRTAPGHPTAKSSSILLYFSCRPRDSDCSMSLFWITDSGEGSPQILQVDTTMDFQLPVEILGWPGLESHWQYYYFLAVSDFVNRHAAYHYNKARASQYNHNQFLVPLAKQYRGIIYKNGKLWGSVRLPFSPLPAVLDLKSGAILVINRIIDDQVRWDDSGFFVDY